MQKSGILEVCNLTKKFRLGRDPFRRNRTAFVAVKSASFAVHEGECLAIVGESGSGKTTLGRCLLRLTPADNGQVFYRGKDLLQMPERELRPVRREVQMIFQNSAQALNPRQSVATCLREPLNVCGNYKKSACSERILELLDWVGLERTLLDRLPHELSGGQRQRLLIARSLTTSPRLIVADEPTSSLDALFKRQIIDLLKDLQARLRLTLILISHDLGVVSASSDRVAVMYRGQVVETAPTAQLLRAPGHPYTKILLASSSVGRGPDLDGPTIIGGTLPGIEPIADVAVHP